MLTESHQVPVSAEKDDSKVTFLLGDNNIDNGDTSAADETTTDHGTPCAVDEDLENEANAPPVMLSLESRIEAILSQSANCAVPFLSPRSTSSDHSVVLPPLPVDDGPPLPHPPETGDANPPLPPPPSNFWPVPPADGSDVFGYREMSDEKRFDGVASVVNGHAGAGDDDDRMSMSSLSSGEEKLEVNVPAGVGDGPWPLSSSLVSNAAYLTEKLNLLNDFKSMVEPTADNLVKFDTILNQVIKDLRLVMCRDVRKKMIENTGFKSFEKWCDEKVQHHKVRFG